MMFPPLIGSCPTFVVHLRSPLATSRAITSPYPSPKYTTLPEIAGRARDHPDCGWYHRPCTPPCPGAVASRQDQRVVVSALNPPMDARLRSKENRMPNDRRREIQMSYVR